MKILLGTAAAIAMLSLLIPGNDTATTAAPTSNPAITATQSKGPSDTAIVSAVRADLDASQASWLPYITDITYRPDVLTVALQVDHTTDREFAEQIAKAIRTNIRLGQQKQWIDWIEITDGAGNGITQLTVASN